MPHYAHSGFIAKHTIIYCVLVACPPELDFPEVFIKMHIQHVLLFQSKVSAGKESSGPRIPPRQTKSGSLGLGSRALYFPHVHQVITGLEFI